MGKQKITDQVVLVVVLKALLHFNVLMERGNLSLAVVAEIHVKEIKCLLC